MKVQNLLVVAFLVLATSTTALSAEKYPILLGATSSDGDSVGKNLVYELKDMLRGSNTFEYMTSVPDSSVFSVSLITMETSEYSTSYSFALMYGAPPFLIFIDHNHGVCGESRIEAGARSILVALADRIASWQGE